MIRPQFALKDCLSLIEECCFCLMIVARIIIMDLKNRFFQKRDMVRLRRKPVSQQQAVRPSLVFMALYGVNYNIAFQYYNTHFVRRAV